MKRNMISFILSLVIVCLLGSYLCIEADRVLKVEDGGKSVQPIYDTQIQDAKMHKKQVECSEMVSVSVDEKVESSQNKKVSEGTHQAIVCQDNEDVDMSLDIQESEQEPDVQDIKGEDLVSQSLYVLEVGHQYGVNDLFVGLNKDVYMRMDDYWFVADDIGQVSVELYFDYHDKYFAKSFLFDIEDHTNPTIAQVEALIPQYYEYNILDYVELSDNFGFDETIRYEVIGNIDTAVAGMYSVDLVVYDKCGNNSVETLYFEVVAEDSDLYNLACSYVK